MEVKQVLVVRKDYPDGRGGIKRLRRGKEISQASHGSIAFITRRIQADIENYSKYHPSHSSGSVKVPVYLSAAEIAWIQGIFTKVCLQVNSEAELRAVYEKAKAAGLEAHLIIDSGKTEFDGVATATCVAIGPDEVEKIDAVTGDLKLY